MVTNSSQMPTKHTSMKMSEKKFLKSIMVSTKTCTLQAKRKSAEQKTYDFVKETVTSFKTLAEENSKNTPEEVKELKAIATGRKVKAGESSSHWKKSYEEAMEELKNNSEKHRKELKLLTLESFKPMLILTSLKV